MEVGVKFWAYPTQEQKKILSEWMGCARFIYNAKCDEDHYHYVFSKQALSLAGQKPKIDQAYAQFKSKELSPWLYEVPSQILRNASYRWFEGYQRTFKGLGGRPKKKSKYGRQSVWLTSELFEFVGNKLYIGTKTRPFGILKFKKHRSFKIPNSITVSKQAGFFYVSFCHDKPMDITEPKILLDRLSSLDCEDLTPQVVGIDRGVVIPFVASTGEEYDFCPAQKKHMAEKEKRRKKYQRRLARQQKSSQRRKKVKKLISRTYQKTANIREDFAHKTSHQLANGAGKVFVFEALKVTNMTKRPAKKWSEAENRYLPNQAKAKAGLNRSILKSAWGKTVIYLTYKAKHLEKLVLEVASHYSSQTCAQCQHACSENRQNQADFVCVACGHIDNADHNASCVIAQRGIRAIKEQRYECVVGGTPKTKNGRGARKQSFGKNANGPNREKPERKEASKNKNLAAYAA
jgi:putative transposase